MSHGVSARVGNESDESKEMKCVCDHNNVVSSIALPPFTWQSWFRCVDWVGGFPYLEVHSKKHASSEL